MNFLKSAVASAISQGPPFPYTFGDRVDVGDSIWSLFNGTRRVGLPYNPLRKLYDTDDEQEDSSNCSIFSFEINANNRSRVPLAKNALRKLKTLRHPGVVKILDSVEVRGYIGLWLGRGGLTWGRLIPTSISPRKELHLWDGM